MPKHTVTNDIWRGDAFAIFDNQNIAVMPIKKTAKAIALAELSRP
jgi:hypothetical protein